jgi:putative membrane protein
LQPDALERIEAAVAEAERVCGCQSAVVIAPASDHYAGRAAAFGVAVGALVFVGLYWLNAGLFGGPPDGLLLLLEGGVAGGLATWLALRWDPLRRVIVPRWRRAAAVDNAAAAAFTREGVGLLPNRAGVLLFVSVMEGKARLLTDVGVKRAVPEAALGEVQAELANAQAGDPGELVCQALHRLAAACAPAFPPGERGEDELPDKPQLWIP